VLALDLHLMSDYARRKQPKLTRHFFLRQRYQLVVVLLETWRVEYLGLLGGLCLERTDLHDSRLLVLNGNLNLLRGEHPLAIVHLVQLL